MKGRRVYTIGDIDLPGDYCYLPHGLGTDSTPTIVFRPPLEKIIKPGDRSLARVCSPPHTFRECQDGSMEVRASILVVESDYTSGWHGFLDEGHIWREC